MLDNQRKNYKEWLKKAKEDEFAGKEILDTGRFFAPACFHFQQMAEKFLKGILIFYKKEFPKIHDLLELETLLIDQTPEIEELHSSLKLLNRYYIETRYPGDYPEFTKKEAEIAFKAALEIKKFVLEKIKSEHE